MGRSRDRSRSMSSSSSGRAAHSSNWNGEDGYRLHVSDLTVGVSRKEVEKMFSKYGPINEVWVATNPPCFAFVNFKHRSDGEQAVKELDGKVIGSSRIGISWARKRNYGGRRGGYRPYSGAPPRRSPSPYRSHGSRTSRTSRYGYSPKRSRSRSDSRHRRRRRSRTKSGDRRSTSRQKHSSKRVKTSQTRRSHNHGDGSASDNNHSPVQQRSKRRDDARDGERERRSRTRSRSRHSNNGRQSPRDNNVHRISRSGSRESIEREASNHDGDTYGGSPVAVNQ